MNQELDNQREPDMLAEYDFSGGVRGESGGRFARGCTVVVLRSGRGASLPRFGIREKGVACVG